MSKKIIAIMASGTGGHVYPAFTIANEFIKKGFHILWVGTENGIENRVINNKAITIEKIDSVGIRGKSYFGKLLGFLIFFKSLYKSYLLYKKYKPILSFGFGGYISVASSIVSFFLRIPVVLHEQNSIAGTSNKINYYFAKYVFETFPLSFGKSSNKIKHVGNPVRDNFYNIESPEKKYLSDKSYLNILIMGGSQGSKFFNESLPFSFSYFDNQNISIKHISGLNNKSIVENKYSKYNLKPEVYEYSDNIDKLLEWSSLVVCRAGSTSISELATIGRATILIPFPYATDQHQLHNALFLANNSATILIQQNDLFVENFVNTLNIIFNDQKRLYTLSKNIQDVFPKDTIPKIMNMSMDIINNGNE